MLNGNHNKQATEKKSENIEIVKFRQFKKMGETWNLKKHSQVYLLKVFVVS